MSGMLDRLMQRHETELRVTRMVTRQETADMAIIALHREFGFGPERSARFIRALNEVANETADMVCSDTKDKEFSISRFEQVLMEATGDKYQPREVRYDW